MLRSVLVASCSVLVALALMMPTAGLAKKKKLRLSWQQFSVPFTCGTNAADMVRAVPGDYAVSIDVHNPSDVDAVLIQRLALSFPPGALGAGDVSEARQDTLPAGAALQVSCAELMGSDFDFRGSPPASAYIQGVLVIEASGAGVTVSRTQTATGATGEVSVDTDRVPARAVSHKALVCHDPSDPKTISIASPAVKAHLAHGDSLGPCP